MPSDARSHILKDMKWANRVYSPRVGASGRTATMASRKIDRLPSAPSAGIKDRCRGARGCRASQLLAYFSQVYRNRNKRLSDVNV
jgi:hypothetical protein